MLLEAGADPTIEDDYGDPPLFLAALYCNNTVHEYFTEAIKIDPNLKSSKDGMTALHIAAEGSEDDTESLQGAIEVCKLLLAEGANINATTDGGVAPIHLAAFSGRIEIVQYLVRQPNMNLEVDCEEFGTPLMTVARFGESNTVQVFLDAGARVDATSNQNEYHTALQAAASRGSEDILRMLVEQKGVDVNATGGTFGSALCAAVTAGNMVCIEMLLEKGADINCDVGEHGTALEIAIACNNWPLVDNILNQKYGAVDVNISSRRKHGTALVAAIESGSLELVKKLLELKADLNVLPEDQEAPVHIAVRKGGLEIVKALVESGADTSHIDNLGMSLLSCAVKWTSFELIPYLLERPDIDIEKRDLYGRTALIFAVLESNDAVEYLLRHKENRRFIDQQDSLGNTALMHALAHSYEPHVRLLLDAGASLHVKDIRGRDALYWAALQRSVGIFQTVVETAVRQNLGQSHFQLALNAAAVTDSKRFVELLLDNVTKYDIELADEDDWRPEYSVARYKCCPETSILIEKATGRALPHRDILAPKKLPSEWHRQDHGHDVVLGHDIKRIGVEAVGMEDVGVEDIGAEDAKVEDVKVEDVNLKAPPCRHPRIARANHPMVPGADGIYYFEVNIIKGGNGKRMIGVGFCEGPVLDLSQMVGWHSGTWGYHSDDGRRFWGDSGLGDPFGPKYEEGDVIGCGVDFKDETAFYTKNGTIIGQAFKNVKGRLYPAVSFNCDPQGCMVSAEFWDDKQNGNKNFRFKGPYNDPATKEISQVAQSAAGRQDTETE